MSAGSIIVEGDAGNFLGERMRGGLIKVEGDAGDNVGSNMRDGTIIVEGDAGKDVGWGMEGGEIHLNGAYASIFEKGDGDFHSNAHGRIYHKGKLIADW
jgi:formylmethanofuran dehydrogenase subunit C